jgi:hypothetical protein
MPVYAGVTHTCLYVFERDWWVMGTFCILVILGLDYTLYLDTLM